jgi:hypothetical protein
VSVDLNVTYLGDGAEKRYFGQYFAQANTQDLVGGFFTPLSLWYVAHELWTGVFP